MMTPEHLVRLSTKAPMPFMVASAAERFEKLRKLTLEGSGVDFLGRCADVYRPRNYHSSKTGVADRSWHKTGRAFDYDQECKALVIVSEAKGGKQYFRTWLRCPDQTGKFGRKVTLRDYRGGSASGYCFDFTASAESLGFERIPAWNGWRNSYNLREFWHYQFANGLTWAAAMAQLEAPVTASVRVYGRNDRDNNSGGMISTIQHALHSAGVLPLNGIDGIFGQQTFVAVKEFQRRNKLDVDGLVGPRTLKALGLT